MGYQIKLDVFEGPLDLLMHLIEKNEVDIYDIPISRITEQYLGYLRSMQQLDLEVASEFLVMAASLLAIKARMLLPQPPQQAPEAEGDMDPRRELVTRLLEYKAFKEAAQYFEVLELDRSLIFNRPVDIEYYVRSFVQSNPLEGVTVWDLVKSMQDILASSDVEEPVHEVYRQGFTITQQMEVITENLKAAPQGISFGHLFDNAVSRAAVIVTFLALLELVRLQHVVVWQNQALGEITIVPSSRLWEGAKASNLINTA